MVILVFVCSCFAAVLGGALVLRPEMIWPLWPGCAVLVALLLVAPRRMWPAMLLAGLAGFAIYDLWEGLHIGAIALLLLADAIEIMIAALGIEWLCSGVPNFTSVKALLRYSLFAVLLAPIAVASISSSAFEKDSWRVSFIAESLGLLTLTPAILSWIELARGATKKQARRYLEAASLYLGLAISAYFTFSASGSEGRPALLYLLVPFLLWAALRFGITGTSNSIIIIAFLAIEGVIHKHGPFTGGTTVNDVLSLQSFLLVAASSFMVLAAVVEEDKAAEKSLHAREELLKSFVKNVPADVAMLDCNMRYLQISDRWCADYCPQHLGAVSQILGRSHYEILPDQPAHWKEIHRRCLQGETLRADEDAWNRAGGTTWVRWEVLPWKTPSGAIGGILIFAEDITRRKQMQESLSSMSRKLIEAQEQERARIARELHDDINQRLALLAVETEKLREHPSEIHNGVRRLVKRTTEISMSIQALSHELHSSKLEYLGIVAGIRSWCREFADRQELEIDFTDSVASIIPFEIGICLFRVLQEALHNAVKHSGVEHFSVQLFEEPNEVHLVISDEGAGFDVEAAMAGPGLGLISMRERVRFVNGTIAIDSRPLGGTTIRVRLPIDSAQCSTGATG